MADSEEFPRDEADFLKLEKLVAKIQQDLAPASTVRHNVRLPGKSGQQRQIDVLVEDKVGQYDIRIVIDCKDYKKPVDVKGVEEFYGLYDDVGAHKGVLVCPAGFTKTAKVRAQQLQIDLYSPVDTDPHKWQARPTVPTICDFRSAGISFGIQVTSPLPWILPYGFIGESPVTDETGADLGTMLKIAVGEWNDGRYPTEPGVYEHVPLLPRQLLIDNGYGQQMPADLYVGLQVDRHLFFDDFPIVKMSGFKDHIRGTVITNAFETGMLDIEDVDKNWKRVPSIEEAPAKPVLILNGLYAWSDQIEFDPFRS
jgi:hypothetical protein